MLETCCDSTASIDWKSLCDFFELNLKGDLGDLGDLGLKADLGLSMKSCSSLTMVVGSVSGCGVDFRAIVSQRAPVARAVGPFRLQAVAAGPLMMSRVAQPGYLDLCHSSEDRSAAGFDKWGMCEGVLVERQCFRLGPDQSQGEHDEVRGDGAFRSRP